MPAPRGTSPQATCQTARRRHSHAIPHTNLSSLPPPHEVMGGNDVEYKVVSGRGQKELMKKVDEMTGGKVSIKGRKGYWTFIGGVHTSSFDSGIWSQALILNTGTTDE